MSPIRLLGRPPRTEPSDACAVWLSECARVCDHGQRHFFSRCGPEAILVL